jgi:alkylation response protein AidB-like acyl-CoA dehydrogenase
VGKNVQLEPDSDQRLMVDMLGRFLDHASSMARVRAALPGGFDHALWRGLAELGTFAVRVPESAGGLGLGIFDACLLMEEVGRTLASGPLAETIVAARLLAELDPEDAQGLQAGLLRGEKVVTLALRDAAIEQSQLVAGGAVADALIARRDRQVLLMRPGRQPEGLQRTLASTPIARLRFDCCEATVLADGDAALSAFAAALEEWKLLVGAALVGLARESIRLAANYACEREQFGRPIGCYQAISHPLAALVVEVDAGRLLLWRAIREIADRAHGASISVSIAAWWASATAEKCVAQALHTFGGYGLTLEYDIHLYNLRAKAWPLVLGDPAALLQEAGRRRYAQVSASLPEAGPMPVEFELGEEAAALAAELSEFFDRNLTPELRARAHYSFSGHDAGIHRKLAQAGLLFPAWPTEMGGRDASAYAVQAALQVWHDNAWTTHAQATDTIVGFIMNRFGSDTLKAEALRRVAAGEACCALGFSEPGSGSDVFAASTRARREGDHWIIDGQKMFTSGAEIADYVLLLARTLADAPKHKGLTMFIVPLKSEGVSIQPVHTFQDERTNITFYEGVRIPDSYRLGEEGGGLKVLVSSLEIEHGMTFVKEHAQLLQAAERFCRDTDRGGRPLLDDATVRARLARVAANVAASEVLNFRTLWTTEQDGGEQAFGPASKMFSSEVYKADAADLLNLTAPESLASASPDAAYINWCYRHSQVATVYGGTSEIHRSMIAERALGLPRSRD